MKSPIPKDRSAGIKIRNYLKRNYSAKIHYRLFCESNPYSDYQVLTATISKTNYKKLEEQLLKENWIQSKSNWINCEHSIFKASETSKYPYMTFYFPDGTEDNRIHVSITSWKKSKRTTIPYYD